MDKLPESQSLTLADEVEIHAPGIDVDAIMATIRRNIERRQAEGLYQAANFPEFEEVTCREEPVEEDADPLLYFLLPEMAHSQAPRFQVEPDLTPSPLDRWPIVGSLWHKLRRQLHGMSIFYTNKLGGQMIHYNRYLVTVLKLMNRQNQKQAIELNELKQRLVELETKLARLEQKG